MNSLCWSPNGKRVLSGSDDGTTRLWDVKSGQTVLGPIKNAHQFVSAVLYSPDSTKFATGRDHKNGVKNLGRKDGGTAHNNQTQELNYELCLDVQWNKLVFTSYGPVRIFDTATWEQIATLQGHRIFVSDIILSQNDRLLVTVSENTARLWHLDTNLPVGPPLQHKERVQCAALSADGTVLVTGGDKDVYAWDINPILKKAGLEDLLLSPASGTSHYSLVKFTLILHWQVAAAKSPMNVRDLFLNLFRSSTISISSL